MKIQNKSKQALEKSSLFNMFLVVSPRHFGRPPLRYPLKSPSKLISITNAGLWISPELKQENAVCTGDEGQGSVLLFLPGFSPEAEKGSVFVSIFRITPQLTTGSLTTMERLMIIPGTSTTSPLFTSSCGAVNFFTEISRGTFRMN